jgi:hypothetical protein
LVAAELSRRRDWVLISDASVAVSRQTSTQIDAADRARQMGPVAGSKPRNVLLHDPYAVLIKQSGFNHAADTPTIGLLLLTKTNALKRMTESVVAAFMRINKEASLW